MSTALLFLSYYGPEESTGGVRTGKLALAASRHGLPVHLVHGGTRADTAPWKDGIPCTRFRRTDPSTIRDKRRATLPVVGAGAASARWSALGRAARRVARTVLQPDEMTLSRRAFGARAREVADDLRQHHQHVVLVASGPPWSTLLTGRHVAGQTGLPLLLDYQDLWSINPVADWPPLARQRARRWERGVQAAAAGIVAVNSAIADRLRDVFPPVDRLPLVVAPIGFEGPLAGELSVAAGTTLSLGHFGSIYGDRSLAGLMEACRILRGRGIDARLDWYGQLMGTHDMQAQLPAWIQEGLLRVKEALPLERARERMAGYDMLVTVPSPSYPEELTGKLYDYLDAGRPVLGLAPEGALLGEFLAATDTGVAVAPEAAGRIADHLEALARGNRKFRPDAGRLAAHQLPAIGRTLANLAIRVSGA